jgi:hypothetical protein
VTGWRNCLANNIEAKGKGSPACCPVRPEMPETFENRLCAYIYNIRDARFGHSRAACGINQTGYERSDRQRQRRRGQYGADPIKALKG